MTLRCRHVLNIKAELRAAGATRIAVTRHCKQMQIDWVLNGTRCHVVAAAHPQDETAAANLGRLQARRACREARAS